MSDDEAYAYFRISGIDQEIDALTQQMGIEPTEAKRKGEAGQYNPSLPDGRWCLHSPLPRSELDLAVHVEALLPLLEARAAAIQQLQEKYQLWLVLVGYYSSRDPGFFLSSDTVKRIAYLGLPIDCDQYCR